MDHDQRPGLIASHVAKTLESFQNFEGALSKAAKSSDVSEGAALDELLLQIENDFTRFKMWVGNHAAHQSGSASLDYRVREAAHLQQQVIYLLEDICESLRAATSLFHDRPPSPEQNQAVGKDETIQLDDSSSLGSSEDDEPDFSEEWPPTSLPTFLTDIREAVDCLLRLSVAIVNPASHERFRKPVGEPEDSSFDMPRDIAYVRKNFPSATTKLANALGRFIARRRHFYICRYVYHEMLASGIASAFSDKEIDTCHAELIQVDTLSDSAMSETSYAMSTGHTFSGTDQAASTLKVPPRPSAAEDGTFRCPFCYRMISAKTRTAWEQHVFGDLCPYACIFPECIESNLDFDRRRNWQSHISKYHWRSWSCPFKCQQPFTTAAELSRHIREHHLPTGTEDEIRSIAALGEKDAPDNTSSPCPLCGYSVMGLAEYIDHVGYHLEQLALFALLSVETEDLNRRPGNNEKSNYEPEVDADSPQILSARSSPVLGIHPVPSFEPPGKGKEADFLDDAMSDIGLSDLFEPTLEKKAVRRDSWSEDIKVEPPVATPDAPADEEAINYIASIRNEAEMQRGIDFGIMKEYHKEPPTDSPGNPMPAHSQPTWYSASDDSAPGPSPPHEDREAAHPQSTWYSPRDYSVTGPALESTDYPTWYYPRDDSLPVVPQSQIHYSMPTHPQSTWYNPPTLQPLTDYTGYYMPQQHRPVAPAVAAGSFGEVSISCVYPGCTARPFNRKADLERHIRHTHSTESNKDAYLCDYSNCTRFREPFHRRDHLRDHLREYHGEDISKRRAPSDMGSGVTTWWRCPRCVARVYVSKHGYECPDCKKSKSEGKRRS